MTTLLQFAERVTTAPVLGGSAKWEARLAFIDTVGCMLAGSGEQATRRSEQAARLWREGCSYSVQNDTPRPEIHRLAGKLLVDGYEVPHDVADLSPKHPDRVTLELTGGKSLEESEAHVLGSREHPIADAALEAKFMTCAERALSNTAALRLLDWLKHAERSPAAQMFSLVHDDHAARLRSRTA